MSQESQLTFMEAKNFCIDRLHHFIDFANQLFHVFPTSSMMGNIIQLETLFERVKTAHNARLFKMEIDELASFGQAIVYFKPDITPQLSLFWDLHFGLLTELQKSSTTFSIRDKISDSWEKIQEVDSISENIVSILNRNKSNNLSSNALGAAGLLLVHIIRVESIEHVLLEQIKSAISNSSTSEKFDCYEICSIKGKVKKINKKRDMLEWRTDVRAIRDSTAHAQFLIKTFENGWNISFSNHLGGYSFDRQFDDKEFIIFFDNFTLLYKSQLILLMLFEMLPILSIHFLKYYYY
jgi:hypothetical protein